jgi:hypothetical protein
VFGSHEAGVGASLSFWTLRGVTLNGPLDGEHPLADLKRIVSFGPRPSGSQALDRCSAFIIDELRRGAIHVSEDTFTATTPNGPNRALGAS